MGQTDILCFACSNPDGYEPITGFKGAPIDHWNLTMWAGLLGFVRNLHLDLFSIRDVSYRMGIVRATAKNAVRKSKPGRQRHTIPWQVSNDVNSIGLCRWLGSRYAWYWRRGDLYTIVAHARDPSTCSNRHQFVPCSFLNMCFKPHIRVKRWNEFWAWHLDCILGNLRHNCWIKAYPGVHHKDRKAVNRCLDACLDVHSISNCSPSVWWYESQKIIRCWLKPACVQASLSLIAL